MTSLVLGRMLKNKGNTNCDGCEKEINVGDEVVTHAYGDVNKRRTKYYHKRCFKKKDVKVKTKSTQK